MAMTLSNELKDYNAACRRLARSVKDLIVTLLFVTGSVVFAGSSDSMAGTIAAACFGLGAFIMAVSSFVEFVTAMGDHAEANGRLEYRLSRPG